MTAPKPGDRVRVVIEGPVFEVNAGVTLSIGNIQARWHVPAEGALIGGGSVSVEVLPPPEPEWQPGDVVLDKLGIAHLRVECGPRPGDVWQTFSGEFHDDTFPLRPLTLVVRDRTLVAP